MSTGRRVRNLHPGCSTPRTRRRLPSLRFSAACPQTGKPRLDLDAFPRDSLRRQLAALGIAPVRHRMAELITLLPVKLNGKPYEDFDADIVAEDEAATPKRKRNTKTRLMN